MDLSQIAAATPGFSGADLANLVNEGALTAVRAGRTGLTTADFADARDRVVLGARGRSAALTLEDRALVQAAGPALGSGEPSDLRTEAILTEVRQACSVGRWDAMVVLAGIAMTNHGITKYRARPKSISN